jgi:uncharacterized membrane-anchored protein YjiN (DUF445 family)
LGSGAFEATRLDILTHQGWKIVTAGLRQPIGGFADWFAVTLCFMKFQFLLSGIQTLSLKPRELTEGIVDLVP